MPRGQLGDRRHGAHPQVVQRFAAGMRAVCGRLYQA